MTGGTLDFQQPWKTAPDRLATHRKWDNRSVLEDQEAPANDGMRSVAQGRTPDGQSGDEVPRETMDMTMP